MRKAKMEGKERKKMMMKMEAKMFILNKKK